MSINKKFIAVMAIFIFLPTILGVFLLNAKVKSDIYRFEDEQNLKNLNSIQAILAQSIDNIETTTAKSWASWDAFHEAIIKKDMEWLEEEIVASAKGNDYIAIVTDLNGNVLCSNDPLNGLNNITNLKDDILLKKLNGGKNVYGGFVQLPKGLAIIGVSKVVTYDDTEFKNPAGVFIFGNYVTKDMLKKLNDVVNIDLSIYSNGQIVSTSDINTNQITKFQKYMEEIKSTNNNLTESSVVNGSRKLTAVGQIKDLNNDLIGIVKCEASSQSSIKSLSSMRNISILTILSIIMLSTFIIIWTHRNIIVPITKIKGIIDLRDLTNKLPINGKDEISSLSASINSFLNLIKDTLIHVKSSSQSVASSSEEMNATVQQLASSSESLSTISDAALSSMEILDSHMQSVSNSTQEVTGNIYDVNKLLENLEQRVNNVTMNINDVQKQSSSSIEATQVGQKAVKDTIDGMYKINSVVGDLVSSIKDLGKSAYEIDEIVNVIEDISGQTNLLALNASIEAARAGEYGKGFEVVASAIKTLAEKSTDATKVISKLIKNVQTEVTTAVDKAKEGSIQVGYGVALVNDAGKALVTIENEVGSTAEVVEKVAKLTEEQLNEIKKVVKFSENIADLANHMFTTIQQQVNSTGEVVTSIGNVSSSSSEMASSTQEVSSATESLAREALSLLSLLDQFKLNN